MGTTASYSWYIHSPAWRVKREEFWASLKDHSCYCCGTPRVPGFHVHHRSYERFMSERLSDLVSVCEDCHVLIHRLHRNDPKWKKLGLWATTDEVRRLGRLPAERRKRSRNRRRVPKVKPLRVECAGCSRSLEAHYFKGASDICLSCSGRTAPPRQKRRR